jgi:two-component system nitrogen regulation response regulator GlnG
MTPLTQAKILRVLQDGQFERVGGGTLVKTNVRVIAATSRNLEAMIAAGMFREDLYYRLNVCTIRLPPLRERREDIPLLFRHFVRQSGREFDKNVTAIAPDAMTALEAYDWPGNVRQLQSVVKRALLNVHGPILTIDALPPDVRGRSESETGSEPPASNLGELMRFIRERLQRGSTNLHAEVLERVERELLTEVLQATDGNLSKSAIVLGITRPTLRSKLQNLGISVENVCNITQEKSRPTDSR